MGDGTGFLGPFGLILGMAHHYAYLIAAIIMGSICLFSTIIYFILAKTHNDLKQRGRYLVFWNGLSATCVVTMYLMLNSFVGNFPCYLLLWVSYMCTIPWLLTYLARGWRLVYIYNQQVDFGNTTLQRNSAIVLNNPSRRTSRDLSALVGTATALDEGLGPPSTFSGNQLNASQASLGHEAPSLNHQLDCSQEILRGARHGIPAIVTTTTMTKDLDAPLLPFGSGVYKSSSLSRLAGEGSSSIHNVTVSTLTPPASASTTPKIPASATMGNTDNNNSNDHGYSNTRGHSNNDSIRRTSSPSGMAIFPESHGVVFSNQDKVEAGPTRENVSNSYDIAQMIQRTQTVTFDSTQTERKRRWSRYLSFNKATDSRLTVFLLVCMIIPFVVCLGMQFVKPSPVQINPVSYRCGEGLVFYPIYVVMLGFLAVGCPILTWKLWWIKDGFGIRNELLINMIIGLPGFILYFTSPIQLKELDAGHWNHVNWLTLTIFFSHMNSVVLPLLQFCGRQRPKKRVGSTKGGGIGNAFASILRWDSPKKSSGTLTIDVGSDTSSYHYHSRTSSQVISPQQHHGIDLCDASIYDGRSIAPSIYSHNPAGEDRVPANHNSTSSGHRLRGMKGFWTRYGKDQDGNIIPLSQLNPRAFEYTLQDADMMSGLVKFSVTVFSAENTKFLQEYDGLRKQVREYYKLAGYGGSNGSGNCSRSRGQKHNRDISEIIESGASAGHDGLGLPRQSRKTVSSVLGGLTASFQSGRKSAQGSIASKSDRASQNGSFIGSIAETEERHDVQEGEPDNNIATQPYNAHPPVRTFGKARQEMKGNLWRLSLHTSFRNSNPAFVSPYGPLHEEDDAYGTMDERQTRAVPSPTLLPRASTDRRNQQKTSSGGGRAYHSEVAANFIEDENDAKHGFSGNDSDSWFGSKITGPSPNYNEVTPSEFSSHQDMASESTQYQSEYLNDSYSVTEMQGDVGDMAIHDPLGEPHSRDTLRPSTPQDQDTNSFTSAPYSKSTTRSHHPLESSSQSQCETLQEHSDLGPAHSHYSQIQSHARFRPESSLGTGQPGVPCPEQRTPVPRALLPAYWEISRTFIMPNATLELNLDEERVDYIKKLFQNNECYLEMYEPIAREVQELVYSNVWPRFVRSIQRAPQGFSEKFIKTWNGLFGDGSRGRHCDDEEIFMNHTLSFRVKGVGGWRHANRQIRLGGSSSRDHLQQQQTESMMERRESKTVSSIAPSPPQASYIPGQFGFLDRGRSGDKSTGGNEKDNDTDVEQFGVMQDLDFTVLQHIVVDPK
ncbi:hypothetical protein BGZ65_003257 [Modicella reniformis]|uniref:RGS domain-containing protein n=1 Tax=Modicella reniformis TaxID=1440133 RepID=A0A9P6STU1_9FUNG|nr:hypothetical protein BGZ65_003257 [Modicella reniformis]